MNNTTIRTWIFYSAITCLLALNSWILTYSFKKAQQHESQIKSITHNALIFEQIKENHSKKLEYENAYKLSKDKELQQLIQKQEKKIDDQFKLVLNNIQAESEKNYFSRYQEIIKGKKSDGNNSSEQVDNIIKLIRQHQQQKTDASMAKSALRQNIFFWFQATISVLFWLLLTYTIYQLSLNSKRRRTEEIEKNQLTWLKNHLNEIDRLTSEDITPQKSAKIILNYINKLPFVIDTKFYIFQGETTLEVSSKSTNHQFINLAAGSLILEAKEKETVWLLKNIPKDYWTISSGFGKGTPNTILFIPITLKHKKLALIEIASFENFSNRDLDLFCGLKEIIGANFNIIQSRQEQKVLLKKTQMLAKELKHQKDDLKAANNVLAKQARELETHQESLNIRNIQLESIQKELELKAEALEKNNTYKSDFLTKVSHELRTPLNGVLLLSTLLIENKERTLTSKQIQFAQSINSAGNDLLLLISDILDLSKIEAHKLTIHEDKFGVKDFINNIYRTFAQQVEIKGIELKLEIEDSLSGQNIKTDKMRLDQIFRNFMSNAIKFTNCGEITIFAKRNIESHTISFGVRDTGIGIEDEKKEVIFKAFEQADGTISRRYGGTGLGLTISLELANLIGGKIKSQSKIGAGSVFEILLPESIITSTEMNVFEKEIKNNDALTKELNPTDKNILIVDDDIRNLFALTSTLERKGFNICAAQNGIDALEELKKTPSIDLVLMDIMMPIMDGYETIKNIRESNSKYKGIPIIALTAHATSEDKEKCLQAGANDFLAKPVKTENLIIMISKQITKNEKINANTKR